MKIFYFGFIIFCLVSCSTASFYGDIDLGSNFYYMVEPAFNSINFSTSVSDPMRSSSYVIPKIEYVGFNKNYILAINKVDSNTCYWIIDKTKEAKSIGYKKSEGRELFSNVIGPIDSIK